MSDGVAMATDKEYKLFLKTLNKEFDDAEFSTGEEMELPNGNSTGSLRLDIDLEVPIYCGAIVEIFSNEGAGKTTLALSILDQGARRGKKVLFIDQEQSLQPTLVDSFPYLRKEGTLQVVSAATGDDALRIAEMWALQFPGSISVIDSVDALIPEATDAKEIGESEVGNLARLMSRGCRKLSKAVGKSGSTIIFLNQLRNKIGTYGNPNTPSGGKALPFYARQRIELMDITKKTCILNADGDQIGHIVRYKIIKNKIAVPFITGEFPLIYGKGIDTAVEVRDLGVDLGLLQKEGNYILVENDKGDMVKKPPKTVADMLRADPEFMNSTLAEIKELFPNTFKSDEQGS